MERRSVLTPPVFFIRTVTRPMISKAICAPAIAACVLLTAAAPASAQPRVSATLSAQGAFPGQEAFPAQTGRLVAGRYGGGATGSAAHLVLMRLTASRRSAAQTSMLTPRCRGAGVPRRLLDTIRLTQITLRRPGRYAYQSPYEETVPAEVPSIGGLKRTGLLRGSARIARGGFASGIIRNRFTLRDPETGGVRGRCDSATVRWSARVPPRSAALGRPAPRPGAGYFGLTGQRLPMQLDVGGGARTLVRARTGFQIRCPGAVDRPVILEAVRVRIAKGRGKRRRGAGRFRKFGSHTRTVRDSRRGPVAAQLSWRLAGRFGAFGAAGIWNVTATLSRLETGEEVARCEPVAVRWRAVR